MSLLNIVTLKAGGVANASHTTASSEQAAHVLVDLADSGWNLLEIFGFIPIAAIDLNNTAILLTITITTTITTIHYSPSSP